jgi:O-antigen ligase
MATMRFPPEGSMTAAANAAPLAWWHPRQEALGVRATVDQPARESVLPFRALLTFTSILIVAPQAFFPALASLRPALLAAAVALAAHVYDCFSRHRPFLRLDPANSLSIALVAWAVLTLPFSYWPGGSVSVLLDYYLKALIVFWLLGSVLSTWSRLRRMCWLLTLSMIPLGVTAVRHFLAGAFVAEGGHGRILGYDAPLTQNPNDLALMLNLGIPLGVGLLLSTDRLRVRLLLIAVIVLDATAVVLTFSRAGFLGLATTVLSYMICLGRRGKWAWSAAVVAMGLTAVLLLPESYRERLSTISEIEADKTRSAQLRWVDMALAVHFVLENPVIGVGMGNNALALNDIRGPAWKEVHNTYLQYGMDLGLPGLLMFLALLISCLRKVRFVQARTRGRGPSGLYCVAEGIQISLTAFAVSALFHPVGYQFYFFYVAGLAVAARAVCETEAGGGIGTDSRASVRH